MIKFKIGQKVKCLDSTLKDKEIVLTVKNIGKNHLIEFEETHGFWHGSCFIPVEEKKWEPNICSIVIGERE